MITPAKLSVRQQNPRHSAVCRQPARSAYNNTSQVLSGERAAIREIAKSLAAHGREGFKGLGSATWCGEWHYFYFFGGEMKWTLVIPQLMMDKCHVALGHTYSLSSFLLLLLVFGMCVTQFLCLGYWGGCEMQGSAMTFFKTRHLAVSSKFPISCPSHWATSEVRHQYYCAEQ